MPSPRTADGQPNTAESRLTRRRSQRIEAILVATAKALADGGYYALNLEKIADALNLSKTALYHYFPSRDLLVDAAIRQVADDVNRRLRSVAATGTSPTERLRLVITDQLWILLRDYPEVMQLFAQPHELPEIHRACIKEMRYRHDKIFREIIKAGLKSGEFSVLSIDVSLHCLHGSLNYAGIWCRSQQDPEERIKEVTETVMLMFASTPHEAPAAR
jgi:TetR/AcrR family transcriptional regulator, regulator of autoinduction and epiphytic fitness